MKLQLFQINYLNLFIKILHVILLIKEVIKFLKINNLFPEKFINDIAKFKMFYPYRYSETGIMGGIQNVEAEWKKGIVNIICEASLGAQLNLKIENNKLIMV